MATTAHEDQYLTAPEPVRQPYSTEAILRRNVAAIEVALRTQTELKQKAEAELAKLAQQKPVAWMHDKDGRVDTCHDSVKKLWIKVGQKQNTLFMRELVPCRVEHYNIPLYAAPGPAPHKGATHCDDCGLTWLDDGLNPLRCPYCKDAVPVPAVSSVVFVAHNKTSSVLFADRKDAEQYSASLGPTAGVSVTECVVIGLQSSPQAPAAPDVPDEWKLAVSEFLSSHDAAWAELFKSLPADTRSVTVSNHQAEAVRKANVLRALLQSAEVRRENNV
jgi:rubrerythrin